MLVSVLRYADGDFWTDLSLTRGKNTCLLYYPSEPDPKIGPFAIRFNREEGLKGNVLKFSGAGLTRRTCGHAGVTFLMETTQTRGAEAPLPSRGMTPLCCTMWTLTQA